MLGLRLPTDPRWAQLVEQDIREVLIDHAWCEQKAASNAISIVVRYPEFTDMAESLIALAKEELDHFNQVIQRLKERGWTLAPERKDHYVNRLLEFVRKDGDRTERLVDRLLFSAMIEARSCERFKLLSERVQDEQLRTFYRDLMISEAGHYTTFIGFARSHAPGVDVDQRWKEFLAFEAALVADFGKAPAIHG